MSPHRAGTSTFPGLNGKIAFASDRDGNSEIYLMNPDGTGQIRLTNNASVDDDPAVSADGTKIAFRSNRVGNNEIYVMNADGSGQIRLTNNAASDLNPAWSPDGTKIAFASLRPGNSEIYVMNANGTAPTRVTNNSAVDQNPTWSPNATKIAFERNPGGNFEIFAMNANGTGQTRLTNNTAREEFPSWSPDGTRIAFTSNRNGNREIFVMNANGSSQSRRTNNAAADLHPAWSPDGTKIAFTSNRNGNLDIFVMNVNGTAPTQLTTSLTNDALPDWAPLRDVTAPLITIVSPVDGAQYAQGQTVNANYSCTDEPGGSGLATCEGFDKLDIASNTIPAGPERPVPNGSPIDTSQTGTYRFIVRARDNSGNTASTTFTYTVAVPPFDETAPTITIVSPAEGAQFAQGDIVNADYSCADEPGGSGLATCEGFDLLDVPSNTIVGGPERPVANGTPIDTSQTGIYRFTVRASDVAGNAASMTVTYTVV